MAKSTHSQEALTGTAESYTDEEWLDPMLGMRRPEMGIVDQPVIESEDEEESSSPDQEVGGDYSQSTKSDPSPTEYSTHNVREPAPTTESPSKVTEQADSSVDSTGGDGRSTRPKRSSRTPAKVANPRQARVRSADDEFGDEF